MPAALTAANCSTDPLKMPAPRDPPLTGAAAGRIRRQAAGIDGVDRQVRLGRGVDGRLQLRLVIQAGCGSRRRRNRPAPSSPGSAASIFAACSIAASFLSVLKI